MIRRIISGGQSGVERAALDVAHRLFMDYGGWVAGWLAEEDESLIKTYRLHILREGNYVQVTERNILDADGVLIIAQGEPTGTAGLYRRLAERHRMPWFYVDLDAVPAFEASRQVEAWIGKHRIEALTVTGPRESRTVDLYRLTQDILETVLKLSLIEPRRYEIEYQPATPTDQRLTEFISLPRTVREAVELLRESLTFHERTRIANLSEGRIPELMGTLGVHVKNEFRLWGGNEVLIDECRALARKQAEDPAAVILRALWELLQHADDVLRVVK